MSTTAAPKENTVSPETIEEVSSTPSALMNFESWSETVNPYSLIPANVRPLNVDHVIAIQNGIRLANGFDGEIVVMKTLRDGAGNEAAEPKYYIFDGHHRHAAIVGYRNLNLGISLDGLLVTDGSNEDLMSVLSPLTVTVYNYDEIFSSTADFLKAQFRYNSGRRNIADNAADAAASIVAMLAAGATPSELKGVLNKSEAWISNAKIAHENCIEELKAAVRNGSVSGKTMIEVRNLSAADQRKLLKELGQLPTDLPEKERQSAERMVANRYISEMKVEKGKPVKFPPSCGRKAFCKEMHEAYLEVESIMAEASIDTKSLSLPGDAPAIHRAIFYKALMQGLLLAHKLGPSTTATPGMFLSSIPKAFQAAVGHAITDADKNS